MDSQLPHQLPVLLGFFKRVLQAHWATLLLLLIGVALPLLLFEQLAIVIWQSQGAFSWDQAILLKIHAAENPTLTQIAATLTRSGGFKGSVVIVSLVCLRLLSIRRWRSLTYLLLAMFGSGLINRAAKEFMHRVRPQLWESAAPEQSFSFPSGHAMATMTLVAALVILTWGSRWCWLVALVGSSFVGAIAWTRLYLGVHFPSDILAGWAVALAWAIGVSLLIRPHATQFNPVDEVNPTIEELAQSR